MVKNLMKQKEYMTEFNEFKDTLFNKKPRHEIKRIQGKKL